MPDATVRDGVCQVRADGYRWLSTGWNGGFRDANAAYNVSVPDGWDRTDLDAYVTERKARAGFASTGPVLLTGVALTHLRGARSGSVAVYATAGVSNPAVLVDTAPDDCADRDDRADRHDRSGLDDRAIGTVNLVVATTTPLSDAAAATLLSVAVEAKTATLLDATGFPGTTTDAVVVGSPRDGDPEPFAGSATSVGSAVRACVRDAVRASVASRYADRDVPSSVVDAEYGTVTTETPVVFVP